MEKFDKNIDSSLKLIAKSSVVVFIGVILSKLFTYFYRIIIARYYGPEIYGLFSLGIIIFTLFVYFASFGFGEGIVRYVSFYRGKSELNKIKYLLKVSSYISIFFGICASIILFILSESIALTFFHNPQLTIFLKILSFFILFNVLFNIYSSFLRAFEKIYWYSFIVNILQNLMKLVWLILLIALGIGTNATVLSIGLAVVTVFLFSYYLCKNKLPKLFESYYLSEKTKKKIRKNLIHYSTPIMFSGIFVIIFYWIDSFLIGYFENAERVGLYNSAIPIVLLFGIATDLFMQMFYPIIVKEYSKENFTTIKELSKQVSKWVLIINLPLFIIMFLFPGAIINFLFGSEYLLAENALRILSIGGFISTFTGILSQILLMAGRSKIIFMNLLVASVINTFLNILLIPKYSLVGAAVSTLISWSFLAIALFIETYNVLKFVPLKRNMLHIILISLIPISFLLIIRSYIIISQLNLFLLAVFFILSYILSILLIKGFDRNDLMILRSFKSKIFKNKYNNIP